MPRIKQFVLRLTFILFINLIKTRVKVLKTTEIYREITKTKTILTSYNLLCNFAIWNINVYIPELK